MPEILDHGRGQENGYEWYDAPGGCLRLYTPYRERHTYLALSPSISEMALQPTVYTPRSVTIRW